MDPQYITLIILSIAVILFVTDWINSSATVLFVCLALYATGILDENEIVSGLTNSSVILAASMFVMGGAILSCGFAKNVGDKILKYIKGERNIMLALMIVAAVLAAFITGTSTISILTPLTIGICQANKEYRLSKLLIPCAVTCTTGGMMTLIGKPTNMVAQSLLVESGLEPVGFFEFAKIGLPVTVALIIFMYFWGYKLLPDTKVDVDRFSPASNSKEVKSSKKVLCLIIFVTAIICMSLGKLINIPAQITALFGVLALFIFGIISDKQAFLSISWSAVFIVAGMLPLAYAMVKTGAADLLANLLISVIGENPSPVLLASVIFIFIGLMTEFMSNTACCMLFAPIGLVLANHLNINPVGMVVMIAAASACAFAMPIGTPIAAYVMGYGDYKVKHFIKVGIPLDLIGWSVSVAAVTIFWAY